jgi:hypothetical protein
MQIRVKNTGRGSKGIWVGGELVFVDGGAMGAFTGASATERDEAAKDPALRVQSRAGSNDDWTDHFKEGMPEERAWLAIARDSEGTDMKVIDLGDRWMIGTIVASERPEGPQGYEWHKIGGDMEALPPAVAVPAEPEAFDAVALVAGNAPDVIAALSNADAERVGIICDAEGKRDGGPRKGVMKAADERLAMLTA